MLGQNPMTAVHEAIVILCVAILPSLSKAAPIHAAVSKLPIELWSCIRVMFADRFRSDFGADSKTFCLGLNLVIVEQVFINGIDTINSCFW
jgi:hypothetical protein